MGPINPAAHLELTQDFQGIELPNRLRRLVFPEIKKLQELIQFNDDLVRVEVLDTIQVKNKEFPLVGFVIGSEDREAPTLGVCGGVHGLERVGAQVALTFLEYIFFQLCWNEDLRSFFKKARLVSIPIVNPGGMFMHRRSNPNGIDLMRNAPIDAVDKAAFMVGGHRISKYLPWYRGRKGVPMEKESQALFDFMSREVVPSKFSIALDLHSGFGVRDRLWYPYAKTKAPFPYKTEALALKNLLDYTYRHHVYHVEPQSQIYTTHGDVWDYLFDQHFQSNQQKGHRFIPLTLEMGSWGWIKKNPLQIFSASGLFNPIKSHRYDRIMRRHLPLLSFLLHAVNNSKNWLNLDLENRNHWNPNLSTPHSGSLKSEALKDIEKSNEKINQ